MWLEENENKFDSDSENNTDYHSFTDFDKYYLNHDKFSDDEGESKCDNILILMKLAYSEEIISLLIMKSEEKGEKKEERIFYRRSCKNEVFLLLKD